MTNELIEHFFFFCENYRNREDMDRVISLGNLEDDDPYYKDIEAFETVSEFLEEIYELAFGDDALNKGYEPKDVLEQLKEFSDNALKWEEEND